MLFCGEVSVEDTNDVLVCIVKVRGFELYIKICFYNSLQINTVLELVHVDLKYVDLQLTLSL